MRNGKHCAGDDRDWSHLSLNGQRAPTLRQAIEAKMDRKRRDRRHIGTAASKKVRELQQLPQGTQFQRITREMINSPAWLALIIHHNAAAVVWRLVDEHLAHAATRNGDLQCTYDDFAKYGIRRKSINEAISVAEQLGFVDVIRGQGGRVGKHRTPSKYRLTFEPSADGSPRTNRWATETCTMTARCLLQARLNVYAGRPQQGAYNRD
jgi:hypothetical protein